MPHSDHELALEVRNLDVRYRGVPALQDVSIEVALGELVAVVGPNGAGKTTLLRSISGLVPASDGEIIFHGERVDRLTTHDIVGRGIAQVPEGRHLFPDMSVRDNLLLGAYLQSVGEAKERLADVEARFPVLGARRRQRAGSLSGGEQQMLAIGRAMMAQPRLLLLDEPSVGLAPRIVDEIGRLIMDISAEYGVGILLVEQNSRLALDVSSRAYVLELGRVVLSGPSNELVRDTRIREAYLSA